MTELNFYKQPFHKAKYGTWVYEGKNNDFVFEFADEFPREDYEKVIFRLNALKKEDEPIPDYNLVYDNKSGMIKNNGVDFIEIRGWGNLTGIGGYNFSGEKAAKIQDDFAEWLIERLTN